VNDWRRINPLFLVWVGIPLAWLALLGAIAHPVLS
jgi:hypothetical protein